MPFSSRTLLSAALALAFLGPSALSATASERNSHHLVVDPAGDGTNAIGTEASPLRTDVLAVDIVDSPSTITFSMKVVDLDVAFSSAQDAVNPWGHDDYIVHALTGPTRLTAVATRDAATGETSFWFYVVTNVDYHSGAHPVPGSFDSATDTVTIEVPVSLVQALYPAFGKGTVVTGIESFARSERRRFSSSLTAPEDTANEPAATYVVGR
jgi:hypothetical protein